MIETIRAGRPSGSDSRPGEHYLFSRSAYRRQIAAATAASGFLLDEFQPYSRGVRQLSLLKPSEELSRPDRHDLQRPSAREPGGHHFHGVGMPVLIIARHVIFIVGEFPYALKFRALVPRQNCRVRLDGRFHCLGRSFACDAKTEGLRQQMADFEIRVNALQPRTSIRRLLINHRLSLRICLEGAGRISTRSPSSKQKCRERGTQPASERFQPIVGARGICVDCAS